MEVAQPFAARRSIASATTELLTCSRAVAGGRRVGQIPGVELDDQRAALRDLLGDLLGQRPVGLHLVDVDPEQQLEVVGEGLEERPLVALEVHPHAQPMRRERLVAAGVQQLDEDVGVAVGLHVRALWRVQRMRR